MQSDHEPPFDVVISDIAGQRQPKLFSSRLGRGRRRVGIVLLLLLLALLVGGELVWAARPLVMQSHTGQAAPLPSVAVSPTPVSPAVVTSLAARPLRLPTVTSLATCPVSVGRQVSPQFGLAAGTGPLYIVGVDADGSVDYVPPDKWGADQHGWGGMAKTLWIFPTKFAGPVLVRGQRLDTAGVVLFNDVAGPLLTRLQILVPMEPSSPLYQVHGDWYIRFNTPGCYGLQIDWLQGTEWIIFRTAAEQGV